MFLSFKELNKKFGRSEQSYLLRSKFASAGVLLTYLFYVYSIGIVSKYLCPILRTCNILKLHSSHSCLDPLMRCLERRPLSLHTDLMCGSVSFLLP